MSLTHKVRKGDKVNDIRRIPHANGTVIAILYDDGPAEVIVLFDNGIDTYDYSEFEYSWTDSYGGVFIIQ